MKEEASRPAPSEDHEAYLANAMSESRLRFYGWHSCHVDDRFLSDLDVVDDIGVVYAGLGHRSLSGEVVTISSLHPEAVTSNVSQAAQMESARRAKTLSPHGPRLRLRCDVVQDTATTDVFDLPLVNVDDLWVAAGSLDGQYVVVSFEGFSSTFPSGKAGGDFDFRLLLHPVESIQPYLDGRRRRLDRGRG